ncbi:hypothetical protein VPH234P10_0079 [Vibrio phage 234P10]|nr:hypothetical protein SIPHO062v1_p0056 [Vibrio phage PS17B.1]
MKGQTIFHQYEDESIKDAPDGYYVAHVEHDGPMRNVAKVSNTIILVKHGNSLHAPMSQYDYRGHVYRIEGPIQRITFTDTPDV